MQNNHSTAYNIWHKNVHGLENPSTLKLEEWHKNALQLSPSVQNLKILEVGCGVGDFALYLAEQQGDVTAVDFSDKAIELAKKKCEFQKKNVNFQIADAQALPFADNSFDVIFSCECLEHIPVPQFALTEMQRVLKPSGRLILTTENYSNAMLLYWFICWLRKEPFNSGAGVQPIEHFFLYWRVKRIFNNAGFRVQKMIGSHHVFLLLPRCHPHTFVVERFPNPFIARVFRFFARHMAFECIKN